MPSATPSVRKTFDEARRLARVHGWREKALVYLTRGTDELLVLEHTEDFPDAGVKVPAGGVEPGEDPGATAQRELFEETGLRLAGPAVHLDSHFWTNEAAPSRIRHYYWLTASPATPDAWSHVVSAGDEDEGMLFLLSFRPLRDPGLTPGYGWECALDRLSTVLKQR
jgi:8-oxo-dGTP diphosphatase